MSAEHGIGIQKPQYIYHSKSREAVEMMRQVKKVFDPKVRRVIALRLCCIVSVAVCWLVECVLDMHTTCLSLPCPSLSTQGILNPYKTIPEL